MYEVVCYNSLGVAFHRFNTDDADILSIMGQMPVDTFGVLVHDSATGIFLDRM